jgi:hypothetical protein
MAEKKPPTKTEMRIAYVIMGVIVLAIIFGVTSLIGSHNGGAKTNTKAATVTQQPPKTTPKKPEVVQPSSAPISDADRAKVVAILSDNNKHYADIFKQGQDILGTQQYPDGQAGLNAMEDPNSAASKFREYQKSPNPCGDFTSNDAFKKADAYYNANNETNGIRSWQNDSSPLSSDLCQWVHKAVDWQISSITTAQLKTYTDKVTQDLVVLANDVTDVQNNK